MPTLNGCQNAHPTAAAVALFPIRFEESGSRRSAEGHMPGLSDKFLCRRIGPSNGVPHVSAAAHVTAFSFAQKVELKGQYPLLASPCEEGLKIC